MITLKKITYLNQIGQRPQLEDSIYPKAGSATTADKLFLVCDGVGGESMGEEASRIVSEELPVYFKKNPPPATGLTKTYINDAQQHALNTMRVFAAIHPEAIKMSTTLTMAHLEKDHVTIAWCGDSRIYHLRNGEVVWKSIDHSLVANLVKQGEITEEQAATHPNRNVITRSLSASGGASEIELHRIDDIRDNDYLLLCTDGVLEQINEDRLKGILLNDNDDKEGLFMTYCKDKTRDNFSLYLLKLGSDKKAVPAGAMGKSKGISPLIFVLIAVLALLILGGIFNKQVLGLLDGTKKDTTETHTVKDKPKLVEPDPVPAGGAVEPTHTDKPTSTKPKTGGNQKPAVTTGGTTATPQGGKPAKPAGTTGAAGTGKPPVDIKPGAGSDGNPGRTTNGSGGSGTGGNGDNGSSGNQRKTEQDPAVSPTDKPLDRIKDRVKSTQHKLDSIKKAKLDSIKVRRVSHDI